jgi:hypothetical protein
VAILHRPDFAPTKPVANSKLTLACSGSSLTGSRREVSKTVVGLITVWHFNPTCAAAASRLGNEHSEIRYYLYDHMMEEKGHEEWVVNDLEVVGVGRQEVRQHRPATRCSHNV